MVDLTEAYRPIAKRVLRGVALLQGRRAVLVQDEFQLARPCELTWAVTTDAKIAIDGARATLSLGGEVLTAEVISPAGVAFSVVSAERRAPERPNKGVRRLVVRMKRSRGAVRVAVLLSPHWADGRKAPPPPLVPLDRW